MRSRVGACFVYAAVSSILTGCFGGSSGRLETVPVTGTVTVDGSPVAGASVTFHPVAEEGSRPAHGTTNAQGVFQLTTYDEDDGAVPGEYKVSITKQAIRQEVDVESLTPSGPGTGGGQAYERMMVGDRRENAAVDTGAIPTKYHDPETSELRRTVDPAGGNEFNFSLSSGGA